MALALVAEVGAGHKQRDMVRCGRAHLPGLGTGGWFQADLMERRAALDAAVHVVAALGCGVMVHRVLL